ncbi:hypothetical protein A3K24_00965 [candidate division Kazan bacterium RIFCSPHIGHO2_01_FULL_44_14]|uniref:HNH nuclease domain-containing protein n=1 Tax=candidate division Kazan bacterium RIFCSPLOWO2_01_FULL_45_19 TaxID=1798538 RepID=A0A1F4NQ66_UNCK3|nr:hypothetical protein [uncultured bacterium]OGB73428.1 MAG: hypothetical protein A3K51_00965 [candidate division Kazan bacterium RIFCSPLOWO2_01_FULL_45_19]OGB77673.1 MAG: hypothetical protein A3K24_00965 [candidate division Kazan bacterium RIFCSPHIGHO2_01_FULL_44_14]
MKRRGWTEEELKHAVKDCSSFRQVLLKLHLRPAGGNYEQIQKYIHEYNLDTQHFRGKGWSAGLKGIGKPRIRLEDILVKNNNFQSFKLKKRLFSSKLKPMHCELCSWSQKTTSGYLPLELHHINGNRHDNRIENLKILCPNCHSLTDSHRGRNRGKN